MQGVVQTKATAATGLPSSSWLSASGLPEWVQLGQRPDSPQPRASILGTKPPNPDSRGAGEESGGLQAVALGCSSCSPRPDVSAQPHHWRDPVCRRRQESSPLPRTRGLSATTPPILHPRTLKSKLFHTGATSRWLGCAPQLPTLSETTGQDKVGTSGDYGNCEGVSWGGGHRFPTSTVRHRVQKMGGWDLYFLLSAVPTPAVLQGQQEGVQNPQVPL